VKIQLERLKSVASIARSQDCGYRASQIQKELPELGIDMFVATPNQKLDILKYEIPPAKCRNEAHFLTPHSRCGRGVHFGGTTLKVALPARAVSGTLPPFSSP
jgi:hypothetical protein